MAVTTTTRPLPKVFTAMVIAGLAAACGSTGETGASDRESGPVATSTAASTPSGTPDLDAGEELARGIDVPWGLTFLPGGEALIGERDTSRVLRLTPGSGEAQQVYQVPGVVAMREGGLLGLAAYPSFADDNLVYANFTAEQDNRIVRFRLDGSTQPERPTTSISQGMSL